jgi:hypothetical protein
VRSSLGRCSVAFCPALLEVPTGRRNSSAVTAEDLAQLSPSLTEHIRRFGAYATDELHLPPDAFDPAPADVDFGAMPQAA